MILAYFFSRPMVSRCLAPRFSRRVAIVRSSARQLVLVALILGPVRDDALHVDQTDRTLTRRTRQRAATAMSDAYGCVFHSCRLSTSLMSSLVRS